MPIVTAKQNPTITDSSTHRECHSDPAFAGEESLIVSQLTHNDVRRCFNALNSPRDESAMKDRLHVYDADSSRPCPATGLRHSGNPTARRKIGGNRGWVAQLAEQWTENPRVGGSIPPPATPLKTRRVQQIPKKRNVPQFFLRAPFR